MLSFSQLSPAPTPVQTSLYIKVLQLPELASVTCGSALVKLVGGPAALGVGMGLAKVSFS